MIKYLILEQFRFEALYGEVGNTVYRCLFLIWNKTSSLSLPNIINISTICMKHITVPVASIVNKAAVFLIGLWRGGKWATSGTIRDTAWWNHLQGSNKGWGSVQRMHYCLCLYQCYQLYVHLTYSVSNIVFPLQKMDFQYLSFNQNSKGTSCGR